MAKLQPIGQRHHLLAANAFAAEMLSPLIKHRDVENFVVEAGQPFIRASRHPDIGQDFVSAVFPCPRPPVPI
jgi:hypothetical protein